MSGLCCLKKRMHEHPEPTNRGNVRLKDMPTDMLPRVKLGKLGRAALTDEELLALLLRTGVQGCNVLELAASLKRAAGSLAALGGMEADELENLLPKGKGIGNAKAATLAAVFELGQRAARESLQHHSLTTAEDVYNLLVGELRYEKQEVMILLLLDTRGMLIRRERIAAGTLTRVLIHPRNVFGPAMKYNAARIILVHNHPSGNSGPSKADVELTRALNAAAEVMCIRLQDHVIIGAPCPDRPQPYYSFAEEGKLL